MNEGNIKSKVISSLFWKLLERLGTQGIQLILQIILARVLSPDDFGTVAIVLVFTNLAQVIVVSGLNTGLIQKKDADELDFSSVLYFSFILSTVLYIIVFVFAPNIASFYNDPQLISLLRVLALTLFPGALNSVQNAYIAKHMLFKKLLFSSLGAIIFSGVSGIIIAIAGGGVWALVVQNLVNQITITIILWFAVKWRPIFSFSFTRIKSLVSFGWKLLISGLLSQFNREIRTLIIGKTNTSAEVGYFNRGELIPRALSGSLDGSIQAVMLPTLSSVQDENNEVKRVVSRSIKTSSFFILPMMFGLAAIAEPAIFVVLGEKWLPAVPFLRIFSISFAFIPIQTANMQAIDAMGRSDIHLKLEIIKKIIGLIILFITVPFGLNAIAIGQILTSFCSVIITAWPNKNLFNYSHKEQISDILPSLGISILMAAFVYLISYLHISKFLILFLQVVFGVVFYFLAAYIFKLESASYLKITMKNLLKSRKS